MKSVKIATLFTALLLTTCVVNSQTKTKYRNVKDSISTKNYRKVIESEKYIPWVAGVCNVLLPPPLGYFYVEEPWRGIAVFGVETLTTTAFITGFVMLFTNSYTYEIQPDGYIPPDDYIPYSQNNTALLGRTLMLSGIIATNIVYLWSIYDVIHIAKVKNLAYQNRSISMELKPNFQIQNNHNTDFAVVGATLKFSF